jgi:hypothetical protein
MTTTHPIILDIEASGFGKGSYPIEVGFALPDKSAHCALIKPIPEWTQWNLGAEQIHGISREQLALHGKPVKDVAEMLNSHLQNQCVYSDGWGNDLSWVSYLFDVAEVTMNFQLESLYVLLHNDQLVIWDETRKSVIKDLGVQRHRASSDALIIQETYVRTRQQMKPGSRL